MRNAPSTSTTRHAAITEPWWPGQDHKPTPWWQTDPAELLLRYLPAWLVKGLALALWCAIGYGMGAKLFD